MYRTRGFRDLILKGIPGCHRKEIWMIASGAIHDVRNVSLIILLSFSMLLKSVCVCVCVRACVCW